MQGNKAFIVVIPVLIILFPLGYSIVCPVFSQGSAGPEPFYESPDMKFGTECVEDTSYMRYHHMDLLKEIRHKAMREGIRGNVGLSDCGNGKNSCRKCHASFEGFCNRCHARVNLRIDCLGCHYYPE